MTSHRTPQIRLVLAMICLASMVGCSEGLLWKTGKYSPWAQKQWAEEEKIANTLFARKRMMTEATQGVINAPVEDQQQVARKLNDVLVRDPVLLLRLHAIDLLGQLKCPEAGSALASAVQDAKPDIRVAAVNAFKKMPAEVAVPRLQQVVGSDSNIDVRLAATRALGEFTGEQTVSALSLALNDSDPALQLRAVESLQRATGENIGRDVKAWQQYVQNYLPGQSISESPSAETRSANGEFGPENQFAPTREIFR